MTWREARPLSGPASHAVLWLILALGLGWLTWPVWSSLTAPDRETVASLTPALLSALLGLLLLLCWGLWRDAGQQITVFAPAVAMAASAAGLRMFLVPGASGIEPVFAVPLLAGVALGAPGGFLTGALACLASSAAMGLIGDPLVGQCLVWGLWGAAGGMLRPLAARPAWVCAIAITAPLGAITGLALNLIGWTGERTAEVGAFLPGVGPWESLRRLWVYTQATSSSFDLTRAVSCAVLTALVGLPVIGALKATVSPTALRVAAQEPPPRISPRSLGRRERSARLSSLWPNQKENPHEHAS